MQLFRACRSRRIFRHGRKCPFPTRCTNCGKYFCYYGIMFYFSSYDLTINHYIKRLFCSRSCAQKYHYEEAELDEEDIIIKKDIEELVKVIPKTEEVIPIKLSNTCKLFRCLRCWRYIFPDDELVSYNDGFIHKICKPVGWGDRARKVKERVGFSIVRVKSK